MSPRLRELQHSTAAQILPSSESIELEPGTGLFLALTRGPHARVTGGEYGMTLLRRQEHKVFSWAQIYFPPLAWQLVSVEESSLLADQGWVDVSGWLAMPVAAEKVLSDLIAALPLVSHPRQDLELSKHWAEVFHDESCFIVESDNAVSSEWMR